MAFCAACGTQMADNSAFCPKCGKATAQPAAASATPATSPPPAGYGDTASASGAPLAENIAGMLAYFTVIPAILFLLIAPYNRNHFVRFHSFQCIFTCIALIVLQIILSIVGHVIPVLIFGFWGLLGLAELALWILLVVKAYQHEMFKLPIVGDLAAQQAGA